MRRRFKRRKRLRLQHLVVAGAATYCAVMGVQGLQPHDPCAAIDWISARNIPSLSGTTLSTHWPAEAAYADLIADIRSGETAFRDNLSGEREVEISETCLILDWPEHATVHWDKRAGFKASLISLEGLEEVNPALDPLSGTRIGLRTAIDGQLCAPTADGPAAILLAQAFKGIHSRGKIAEALRDRLGARPVTLNEDIYRTSLISPRNYFESKQILNFLVREHDRPFLINAYLENTAERVVDYASGTFAVFEIIDISPIAARLSRERDRCEVGPETGPLPKLAL